MKRRKAKENEKVLIIKVKLKESALYKKIPKVERIVAIPENMSLYHLAEISILSFNFDFDHCFGFFDNLKNPYESEEGYELFADVGEESDFAGVKKTKIKSVFDKIGKKMLFLFDYGDEWIFSMELIEIINPELEVIYPIVTLKKGEAPAQYPDEEDMEE